MLKDRMTIEMMELYLRDRKLDYLITVLRERLSDDLKQKFAIEEFKQIILTTSPDQFAIDFEPFPESEEQLRIPEVKEEKKPALKIIEEEPAENSNLPHFDVEKLFLEIEQEKLVFPTLPDHSKKKEEAPAEAEQPDLELSAPAPEPVSNEISDSLDDGEIEEDLEAIGRHTETIDDTQSFIEPEEAPETLPPQESILQEIRAAMNSNPDADQTEIDQDEILAGAEAEEQTIEPITELEAEIEPEVEHKETPASTEENALIIEEIKAAIEEPAQAPAAPKEEAGEELLNFFTTKETMKIVGSIFNNDSIDFVNTIEKISACGELDEAMSILKSVYFAYSVNAFDNKEVHLLEDRIQKYFTR
jgi:hypothetical protein